MRWLSFLLVLFLFQGCVSQQDLQVLEGHIVTLSRRVDTLQTNQRKQGQKLELISAKMANLEKSIGKLPSTQGNLLVRLGEIEDEIKQLRNTMEQNGYAIERLQGDIQDQKQETKGYKEQISELETKLEQTTKTQTEKIAELESQLKELRKKVLSFYTPKIKQGPKGLYNKAFRLLRQKKYKEAQKAFNDFLKFYPNSPLAANAQYWIGDIYFAKGHYEEAILAYQKVIKEYPKHEKVPSALFKQAKAFAILGDKPTAKILYEQLIKRFPNTRQAKMAKTELAKMTQPSSKSK